MNRSRLWGVVLNGGIKMREYKFLDKNLVLDLDSEADESVFREVFLDRDYMILDDLIKKAKCVVDVGGHIGLFALYAKCLNPPLDFFAYEPSAQNYARLKKNLDQNNINIFAKNVAIAGNDGTKPLFLSSDSHNHSLIDFGGSVQKVSVPTISFSKIFERDLARNNNDSCDLVKMDCEGAEFEIIKNTPPQIFKKISNLYIEYHQYFDEMNVQDIKDILEKNSFRVRITQSRYDKRMGFILAKK